MKEKTTQEVLELLLHRLKIDKTSPVSKIHQLWGRRKAILERLKERFPELKITQIQVRSGT